MRIESLGWAIPLVALACGGGASGLADGGSAAPGLDDPPMRADGGASPGGSGGCASGTCDGGSGSGSGGGGGTATPDAGGPDCQSVCFARDVRPETRPTSGSTPTPTRVNECNVSGLARGQCPSGWRCGRDATMGNFTFPVCEPNRSSPYTLNLDLPAQPPPMRPLDVTFKFTLNGRPWPSVAGIDAVGTLYLSPEPSGPFIKKEIPATAPNDVRVTLEAGTYLASLTFANTDKSRAAFPPALVTGRLVVRAPGVVVIDVPAVAVSYEVTLNGATIRPLPAEGSLWVVFAGWQGAYVIEMFADGQAPRRTVFLEPGKYMVSVQTHGETASIDLPVGSMTVRDPWELQSSPSATSARFDVSSVDVSGAVRLNGRDLGAATESGSVDFFGGGTLPARFAVTSTRPARYRGKLFPGSYDVYYNGAVSRVSGMPRGGVRVRQGYSPSGTLDVALATVAVSGEVTRNNATVPDSSSMRGVVTFRPPGPQPILFYPVSLNVPARGRATFAGNVFAGTYDVFVEGRAEDALPTLTWPAKRAWQASATPLALDIPTRRLDLTVTLNGAQPADAPPLTLSARGSFTFALESAPATQEAPISAYAMAPQTGPLKVTALLPPGRWSIHYGGVAPNYTGMPQGFARRSAVDLVADAALTWNLRAVDVSGAVTLGGRTFPAPARGFANRGTLSFMGLLAGGGASVPIAASGAATYRAWLFPGVYSVTYICSDDLNCDPKVAGEYRQVLFGVELGGVE